MAGAAVGNVTVWGLRVAVALVAAVPNAFTAGAGKRPRAASGSGAPGGLCLLVVRSPSFVLHAGGAMHVLMMAPLWRTPEGNADSQVRGAPPPRQRNVMSRESTSILWVALLHL